MGHTILIADDDPLLLDVLCHQFDWKGYRVLRARDGQEALDQLAQSPDVMLLDVMMPRKTGYEVCRALKNDPKRRWVPVILVSGRRAEMARQWGFDCGADAYQTKSFGIQELERQVGNLLEESRARFQTHTETPSEARQQHPVLCRWIPDPDGARLYRQKYGETAYQGLLRDLPAVLGRQLSSWGVQDWSHCSDYEAVSLLLPGPKEKLRGTLERLTQVGNAHIRNSCEWEDPEVARASGAAKDGKPTSTTPPLLHLIPKMEDKGK